MRDRFDEETAGFLGSAVSPDGKTALTGARDSVIILWDLATGEQLNRFRGHTGYVYDVVFSPDGTHALSAAEDGSLRLWRLRNGAEKRSKAAAACMRARQPRA